VNMPVVHQMKWVRSTKCESSHCVEILASSVGVQMRDAKDPAGSQLSFTPDSWSRFIGACRRAPLRPVGPFA
jgi:Domain of unknown function (DUF397)